MDYEAISVNMDPDDIPRLREKINAMMWHDSSMADMREAMRGIKVGAVLGNGGGDESGCVSEGKGQGREKRVGRIDLMK